MPSCEEEEKEEEGIVGADRASVAEGLDRKYPNQGMVLELNKVLPR